MIPPSRSSWSGHRRTGRWHDGPVRRPGPVTFFMASQGGFRPSALGILEAPVDEMEKVVSPVLEALADR